MHILIFNQASSGAEYGIGTFIREALMAFKKLNCRISVVEVGSSQNEFKIENKEDHDIIHFPIINNELRSYKAYYQGVVRLLEKYLGKENDLLFSFNYISHSVLIKLIKVVFPESPIYYTVHFLKWSLDLDGRINEFREALTTEEDNHILKGYREEKETFQLAHQIICLAEDTKKMLEKEYGMKGKPMVTIANGLKDRRSYNRQSVQEIRNEFHISTEDLIIIYAGRISLGKGIQPMMEAFCRILTAHPTARLVLAGSGRYDDVFKKMGNAAARTSLTGKLNIENLDKWYKIADVGIFPSYYEQCSYVGIEMMMFGLPIIATDGENVRNMFVDGQNCLVSKIGNSDMEFTENLESNLLKILSDACLRKQLGVKARRCYEEKYSNEIMAENYARFYEKTIIF